MNVRASDLLAELQRQNGGDYDRDVRQGLVAAMAAQPDAVREKLKQIIVRNDTLHAKYRDRLPTRYQSATDYIRLAQAKEWLDKTLNGGGSLRSRDDVVFGSVETKQLNAFSTYCSDSQYLIVFNRGLLTALLRVCNYLTLMTRINTRSDGSLDLERTADDFIRGTEIDSNNISPHLSAAYRDLLTAVSAGRMPDPRQTVPFVSLAAAGPDGPAQHASAHAVWRDFKWTSMEDSVTGFVFTHEYMHVLLGHLSQLEKSQPDEDAGGWGNEYEADSRALSYVGTTWMNEWKGDPQAVTWLLQAVSLFFIFMSQIERYTAEVMGEDRLIWQQAMTHPPTWMRYIRLRSEIKRYSFWKSIEPHIRNVEESLEKLYQTAVGADVIHTSASAEWWFQRLAFGSHYLGLLPQHMVVLAHCVKMALRTKRVPEGEELKTCLQSAARYLSTSAPGVLPLTNEIPDTLATAAKILCEYALGYDLDLVRSPLVSFPTNRGEIRARASATKGRADSRGSALWHGHIAVTDAVDGFADRLIGIAVRDALTRYPYRGPQS